MCHKISNTSQFPNLNRFLNRLAIKIASRPSIVAVTIFVWICKRALCQQSQPLTPSSSQIIVLKSRHPMKINSLISYNPRLGYNRNTSNDATSLK